MIIETADLLPIISPGTAGGARPSRAPGIVTLIRPSRLSSAGAWSVPFTPPIGLAYLAATLRQAGATVKVIDGIAEAEHQFISQESFYFQGLKIEEIIERIDPATEVVGVSCMFSQDWPYTRRLMDGIRSRLPNVLIVAGGEHVSALSEESLRDCVAMDVIVLGEGEETFTELVLNHHDRGKWHTIAGLAFLNEGRLVRSAPRPRIREVDQIPWPAWDLFPMETYLATDNMFGVNRGRTIGVLATRGCPYQCTFCSNPSMYGKAWVARQPTELLDEIEHYIKTYGVENVDFYDLTMVLKRDWILEFAAEIERRGLKFTWQLPSGTRSEVVDDEVAMALFRTGCRNLCFAPESGSLDTLTRIKKRIDLKRLTQAARSALNCGIHVKLNMIIGFPHETRRHLLDTLFYSWRMAFVGVDAAETMVFTPYPGTALFDELRASGAITNLDDDYYTGLGAFLDPFKASKYCRHISGRELAVWRAFNMLSFFALSFAIRPWRLIRLVANVFRNRSVTVVEHRLGVLLRRLGTSQRETPGRAGSAPIDAGLAAHSSMSALER